MTIFGIGIHILIAVFFAIHVVRNGQQLYWLLILFMFPLLGSVVYFFAIYLPNSRCLLYTSPSPRDQRGSRMPSSA